MACTPGEGPSAISFARASGTGSGARRSPGRLPPSNAAVALGTTFPAPSADLTPVRRISDSGCSLTWAGAGTTPVRCRVRCNGSSASGTELSVRTSRGTLSTIARISGGNCAGGVSNLPTAPKICEPYRSNTCRRAAAWCRVRDDTERRPNAPDEEPAPQQQPDRPGHGHFEDERQREHARHQRAVDAHPELTGGLFSVSVNTPSVAPNDPCPPAATTPRCLPWMQYVMVGRRARLIRALPQGGVAGRPLPSGKPPCPRARTHTYGVAT